TKFWDAMSASPISASSGVPLILVQTTAVPAAASGTVADLGLTGADLYVVGPTSSVAANVATTLGTTNRIIGSATDQYNTARAVTNWGIAQGYLGTATVGICSKLPDALGAGTYLGYLGGGMLFTAAGTNSVPSATTGFLSANKSTLRDVFIFGGNASVTPGAKTNIDNALKP
ncbi:MAG: hypothetical protein FDZ75_04705, partial [Actinobacteria bacterium]